MRSYVLWALVALAASGCQRRGNPNGPAKDADIDEAGSRAQDGRSAELDALEGEDNRGPSGTALECSGRGDRPLLAFVRVASLPATELGSQMVWDNGSSFLFVDDACSFWVFDSRADGALAESRTGNLTSAEFREISLRLHVSEWPVLAGTYRTPLFDAPPDILAAPGVRISCQGLCRLGGGTPAVTEVYTQAMGLMAELYERGKPVSGPVRITVMEVTESFPDWKFGTAEWPVTEPTIEAIARPLAPTEPGSGHLISESSSAAFRRLRAEQRNEKYSPRTLASFIPVRARDQRLYGLFVRDVISPLEDMRGFISIP